MYIKRQLLLLEVYTLLFLLIKGLCGHFPWSGLHAHHPEQTVGGWTAATVQGWWTWHTIYSFGGTSAEINRKLRRRSATKAIAETYIKLLNDFGYLLHP